jgi:Rieske Fe-S protein
MVTVGNVRELPVGKFEARLVTVTAHGSWFNKKVERMIWLCRNADETVTVLSGICPHLNYTINNWQQDLGIFKCPGHKSAFDSNGRVLEGPLPDRWTRSNTRSKTGFSWCAIRSSRRTFRPGKFIREGSR